MGNHSSLSNICPVLHQNTNPSQERQEVDERDPRTSSFCCACNQRSLPAQRHGVHPIPCDKDRYKICLLCGQEVPYYTYRTREYRLTWDGLMNLVQIRPRTLAK